jgi:hypothetical protein
MKRTSLPLQRREFIRLLFGAAAASPLTARAQQSDAMRHLGVNERATISNVQQLRDALEAVGWTDGKNITYRYGGAIPSGQGPSQKSSWSCNQIGR